MRQYKTNLHHTGDISSTTLHRLQCQFSFVSLTMRKYTLIKINASTFTACDIHEVTAEDIHPRVWDHSKHILNTDTIIADHYELWCDDNARHRVMIFADEYGLEKRELPNHRANALIDAGRFTSQRFDEIDDTPNQHMKEESGANYFVGDVVCLLQHGQPMPDLNVYGNNPVAFIMSRKQPSQDMIDCHPQHATNMVHSTMVMDMTTIQCIPKVTWINRDYHIKPKHCTNEEYLALLQSWGL